MTMPRTCSPTLLFPMALLSALMLGCRADSTGAPPSAFSPGLLASRHSADYPPRFSGWSAWSEPVNVGTVVNSAATDIAPKLSPDGLSLYFVSNRPGGLGAGNDIWVSRRASRHGPWETPVNVSAINSPFDDNGPSLSPDGRLLFFNSGRPGGHGAADLYVSRRTNLNDDFGWGPPMNLGPLVNTADGERGPDFVLVGEDGKPTLYFNRGNIAGQGADLYAAPMTVDGEALGPAVLLADVSVPGANDAGQSVRRDGRVIWFWSERAGGFGDADLWMSSRRTVHDAWSEPLNLGSPPNTEFAEERPFVTGDGRTLLFDSFRPGGVDGSQDIWMSTGTPLGDVDDEADDNGRDDALRFSDWSEPVWLGPIVNSSARDWKPSLSPHGLSLYFHSNRAVGGLGGFDIWVSRRAGPNCPWQAPVDLGPPVNTPLDDGDVNFTPDGRVLFFSSDEGHGGAGAGDIFMARRVDPNDDFGWGEPVNLGPDVNTPLHEANPEYVAAEDGGTLYFERSVAAIPSTSDIYRVSLTRDGHTRGPAVLVSELSAPGIADASPAVRADGREVIFWSGGADGSRPGGVGLADLWVSTRQSVNDPWSEPRDLGRPLNSEFAELSATLSQDGRTLFFTAAAGRGGLGLQDMWMSTRGPSAGGERGNAASCGS